MASSLVKDARDSSRGAFVTRECIDALVERIVSCRESREIVVNFAAF